ncbi:MAG: thioredoxin family protein [Aggregatilineales bacterium]
MIERIVIVALLSLISVAAYKGFTWKQIKQASTSAPSDPLLFDRKAGVPTIVYFTTPTCAPCKLQQTPTLDKLQTELGENGVQVIRVDATEDPDAADRWGVFSVPTTFIVDHDGKPRHVHNGVVSAEKLKTQIQAIVVA